MAKKMEFLVLITIVTAIFSIQPAIAEQKQRTVFQDCEFCPSMVVVPQGNYGFGSPLTNLAGHTMKAIFSK